jgi:hypothetical protein
LQYTNAPNQPENYGGIGYQVSIDTIIFIWSKYYSQTMAIGRQQMHRRRYRTIMIRDSCDWASIYCCTFTRNRSISMQIITVDKFCCIIVIFKSYTGCFKSLVLMWICTCYMKKMH